MDYQAVADFYLPQNEYDALISIPHSGSHFPSEFEEYLTSNQAWLNEDVDFKVDKLVDIEKLNQHKIAVLVAKVQRTCVDLNRSEDLAVIAWKKNSKGKKLKIDQFDEEFRKAALNKYYHPYYHLIKSSLENLSARFDNPVFIDLHSMPSEATEYHLTINPDQDKFRPSFCISDISGKSCSKDFIDHMQAMLSQFEENTTQNVPYFGGHITRRIDELFPKVNNIQIEINRNLYMDEVTKELIDEKVLSLRKNLTSALIDQVKKFTR